MLIFLSIVFGLYALLVFALCWGWASLDEKSIAEVSTTHRISLVVAIRNEEESLPALIQSLKQLNYPIEKTEFVLVDDHSRDGSAKLAKDLTLGDNRFTVISATAGAEGKKQAITAAIARANGDIILITDADCVVPVSWLTSMNAAFARDSVKMVAGPVRLTERDGFERLQAMEFASLIGVTGATIALGNPTMCNAANLAFRRTAFNEVNGFEGNETVSSGDDQFLLQKFAARWKGCVSFANDSGAAVTANAASTFGEFIMQRLRWAGKWQAVFDVTSLLALAILTFHICFLLLIATWLYGSISTNEFIALSAVRLFAEVVFLFPVCRFLNTRWRWLSFLFLQFFYPLYVISIGFLSQILTARWKGREVRTGVWTGIS